MVMYHPAFRYTALYRFTRFDNIFTTIRLLDTVLSFASLACFMGVLS